MLSMFVPSRRHAMVVDEDFYFQPVPSRTKAGVDINEQIALTFSTVFLCTRIIAEPIAGLPIRCYERKEDGDRVLAKDGAVPALDLLAFSPNPDMTAYTFRESRTMHQTNWGGGFAEIARDSRGRVAELWPIHPSRIGPPRDADSKFAYEVKNDDGSKVGMYRDEVLHICGTLSDDGLWGRGIIQNARETIGGGLATDRRGWAYFGSGAQPKGVLSTPGLKTADDKRAFRRQWKEVHGSPDSCEVAIVPKESTYTPVFITNADSQFLESRIFNRKVICELYRVPTYMIGERATGTNVESMGAEFIMYTLYPWIRKQEEQFNFKLLDVKQRRTHFFEHDFSSLLRGDVIVRMNAYRVGITTGVFTINHCRRMENLPGIGAAGDVNYVPANMLTAEQMMEGDTGAKGPGSDHSGAPADNPLDHEPKMFDAWRRRLPGSQGEDLQRQLRAMESQLTDRRTDWAGAARLALQDVLGRMLHKEANAAQRAADAAKGGELEPWIREFYGKHEALLNDALRPACATLRLAGVAKWEQPKELAAWLKSRSVAELQAAYNGDTKETFAKRLAAWSSERAYALTEEILGSAA